MQRRKLLLAFDFSLSSTGWVFLDKSDPLRTKLIDFGLIQTTWAGVQWWAPERYIDFFRKFDALIQKIQNTTKEDFDFAAEQVVWNGQSTPALFALHQRFWEWAIDLKSRLVYISWSRWKSLLVEKSDIPKEVRDIEGKALAGMVFHKIEGIRAPASDVSDAWAVGQAASRFYNFLDGFIDYSQLSTKEKSTFSYATSKTGPMGTKLEYEAGLKHERGTNFFDWMTKNG